MTTNTGITGPSWFSTNKDPGGSAFTETQLLDKAGFAVQTGANSVSAAADLILALIEKERLLLPVGKQLNSNIYLGGFSQGGATTLATFCKFDKSVPLRGVFVGASWTPLANQYFANNIPIQQQIPMIRWQGAADTIIFPENDLYDFNVVYKDKIYVGKESNLKYIETAGAGHGPI